MQITNETKVKHLGSLRNRYLIVAAVITVLLVFSASLANWHVLNVSENNTAALKLRVQVNKALSEIRGEVRRADTALNTLLIQPLSEHEDIVNSSLTEAELKLTSLLKLLNAKNTFVLAGVEELHNDIYVLHEKARYLIEKRRDSNWVYPVLPYINEKLLLSNNEFQNAVELALHIIEEEDGRAYASEQFGRFDQLRDLWRYKILNFRVFLIRFAGLGQPVSEAQEQNVENAQELIDLKLSELQVIKQQGDLDLELESIVDTLKTASDRWYENWGVVKDYRKANIWRNDTRYMEEEIQPIKDSFFKSLSNLEDALLSWSDENVNAVQATANDVSEDLWLLSGIGIAFVLIVYFMIEHSILRPILKISNALSAEGQQTDYSLEKQSSIEIHQLVTAFVTMRQQIHQRQTELQTQALYDALTGLPNRTLLGDRIEQAMKEARRMNDHMSLLILDLDRFKDINDALGHPIGDRLLQHVGKRLTELVRESDTVARLGGDEFAIVAPGTDATRAILFADKVVKSISDVFNIDAQKLYVGVSIGIAVFPEHGSDVSTLTRHSDVAMYDAKRKQQGFSLYMESQDQGSADKLALVGELHQQLVDATSLKLHYQPQINLFTREVIGVEALLRWEHPDLGPIPPEHIVNMAEHTGQIDELTDWVIRTVIQDCNDSMPKNKIRFSINLSARNLLDHELPTRVEGLLGKYGIEHSALTFEITESAMMSDPVHARETMNELSEKGIKLSVDDYGTGFSSLGYLKLLPVDELKIDKSFVINMLEDENDAIIVHSTIELAHNLGLKVVAEGVEDQAALLQLRSLKCDIAQGYHISRPLPKEDFCVWLENYTPRFAGNTDIAG